MALKLNSKKILVTSAMVLTFGGVLAAPQALATDGGKFAYITCSNQAMSQGLNVLGTLVKSISAAKTQDQARSAMNEFSKAYNDFIQKNEWLYTGKNPMMKKIKKNNSYELNYTMKEITKEVENFRKGKSNKRSGEFCTLNRLLVLRGIYNAAVSEVNSKGLPTQAQLEKVQKDAHEIEVITQEKDNLGEELTKAQKEIETDNSETSNKDFVDLFTPVETEMQEGNNWEEELNKAQKEIETDNSETSNEYSENSFTPVEAEMEEMKEKIKEEQKAYKELSEYMKEEFEKKNKEIEEKENLIKEHVEKNKSTITGLHNQIAILNDNVAKLTDENKKLVNQLNAERDNDTPVLKKTKKS